MRVLVRTRREQGQAKTRGQRAFGEVFTNSFKRLTKNSHVFFRKTHEDQANSFHSVKTVKISGAKRPERVRHLVYHKHSIPRTEIDRFLVSLNMGKGLLVTRAASSTLSVLCFSSVCSLNRWESGSLMSFYRPSAALSLPPWL